MNDFKAYASRGADPGGIRRRDAQSLDTSWQHPLVNNECHLTEAIEYVLERQGEPMAIFDGRTDEQTTRAATVRERPGDASIGV